MPPIKKPLIKLNPSWISAIISVSTVLIVAGIFYGVTNHRLDQLEKVQKEYDLRTELAVVKGVVKQIKERTNDKALEDWNRWRATKDAKDSQFERDLKYLRDEVYGDN